MLQYVRIHGVGDSNFKALITKKILIVAKFNYILTQN
jgi:hypothetical protein